MGVLQNGSVIRKLHFAARPIFLTASNPLIDTMQSRVTVKVVVNDVK